MVEVLLLLLSRPLENSPSPPQRLFEPSSGSVAVVFNDPRCGDHTLPRPRSCGPSAADSSELGAQGSSLGSSDCDALSNRVVVPLDVFFCIHHIKIDVTFVTLPSIDLVRLIGMNRNFSMTIFSIYASVTPSSLG